MNSARLSTKKIHRKIFFVFFKDILYKASLTKTYQKQTFKMKKYLILLVCLLSTAVYADNKQTVKVDGQVIGKTITEITFDDDNVTLRYADNSSDTMDMSLVSLSFTYGTSAGIHQVEQLKEALQGKVFNLNGQLVGNSVEGLSKGVYIVNGKKVIIK